jgi:hypothetical protein
MLSKMKIKMTASSILLAYLAVCLPVFNAEVNLPVAKDLGSHGVTQADLDGLDAIMLRAIEKGTVTGCCSNLQPVSKLLDCPASIDNPTQYVKLGQY